MQNELLSLPIDMTLTYDNARARGYQWEADVIRNSQGKIEGEEHIHELVKNEGYKLGQSWANNNTYIAPCGLYKPLPKPDKPPKKL